MIPKVEFKFDREKDLQNIWRTCNSGTNYGYDFKKNLSKDLIKICKGKEFDKCRDDLLNRRKTMYNHFLMKSAKENLNSSWQKIEEEYFGRLEKFTKVKFKPEKVNGYITTVQMCPYSPNRKIPYFYVNFFANIPNALHTAGHELMHIHLHNSDWWKSVEDKIGYNKTHDFKEALTELLNLEFQDLWLVQDKSYPNHEKLRKYISQQWSKKKDFDLLTENCVKWIKRNGVK